MSISIVVATATCLAAAEPAWAQSCGGCAGPPPASGTGAQGSWLLTGQGQLRLLGEYEVKDRSYRGRDRVDNDFDESLFVTRGALDLRYGLSDDWSAELTLTYPHFTYRVLPPGGERIKQRYRGPGDTFLFLGRRIFGGDDDEVPMTEEFAPPGLYDLPHDLDAPRARPFLVSIWGGVSLPTGTPEEPNPAVVTEDISVSNLQTGTGTFDPMFRIRAEWPQTGFTPYAEFGVRFPLVENRFDYRTADTEALVVGADVPLVPKLTAGLAALFQRTGRDTFRGEDVGVGGARWIYAVPSVSWQVTESVSLDFGVRIPVYRDTDTKLSDSPAVFQGGITWRF